MQLDVGIIRSYAEQGMTRQQIAESVGLSYNRVTDICREHGINPVRKKRCVKPEQKRGPRKRTKEIIQLRESGMKLKDIASAVGCTKDGVSSVLRSYGFTKEQKLTEDYVANIVKDSGFEYVSGYVSSKKNIKVRCPDCGGVFERRFNIFCEVAHGTRKCGNECPICRSKEQDLKAKQKKEKAEHEAQKIARQRAERLSRTVSEELEKRLAIHVCKNCGNEFCQIVTGYNSKMYCSEKCQKRYFNRRRCEKRYKKLMAREHNSDISLEKLFKRDNGICYLCGNKCDWSDGEELDGTFIAGPRYPSIDHVVPVSKGGTHTWNNIKLACRECNWTKRDNV